MNNSSGSHRCPVCTIVGLPIMPLRYGLAWAGEDVGDGQKAPELSAPFATSVLPALGTDKAHYTLRLLRAGYLYVYDEGNDDWSGYEVDDGGTLYRFDIEEGPLEGGAPAAPAMCSRTAPLSLARCIQITNAERAGRVWLAFTDTRWTLAVKARHDDAGYRARHMRCIDAGAWLRGSGSAAQPHAAALSQAPDQVAEYVIRQPDGTYHDQVAAHGQRTTLGTQTMAAVRVVANPAFQFSPYVFSAGSRGDFTGVLWGEHPDDPVELDVPPLMVALDDPVGVTADVAALMNYRLEEFMHERDRVRPLAASAAILQLRDAVEHQAVLTAVEAMDRSRDRVSAYADMRGGPGAGDMAVAGMELTPGDLTRVRREAWHEGGYLSRYDEVERADWQAAHEAELHVLDETVISPLAEAHLQMLESGRLKTHLQCNYDPGDVHSGAGYLGAVLSCIADTQDKAPQAGLYERWFNGSPREQGNLLLRAYALNQDDIAEAIATAAEEAGQLRFNELPWERLFTLYGEVERLEGGSVMNVWMATLIKETTGPATKLLGRAVDSPAVLYGLVAWGAAGNIPMERVVLKGRTSGQIITEVMMALEQQAGRRPKRSAVRAELRRLGVFGLDSRQMRDDIGFIGIREDGGLVTQARYRAQRSRFITGKLVNWRNVMDTDLRVGVAGSVLSAVALASVYQKATSSMKHEREESWVRFWAASVGVLGGALELGGGQAQRLGNGKPRFARFAPVGELVGVIGKRITAAAGFFMAGVDAYRGWQEAARGNKKMASLHWTSATAGAGLTFAILAGSLVWGVIFFVLVVAVVLVMMVWGDNGLHAWLDRCLWGKLEDERYPTSEIEGREYQLAAGAN